MLLKTTTISLGSTLWALMMIIPLTLCPPSLGQNLYPTIAPAASPSNINLTPTLPTPNTPKLQVQEPLPEAPQATTSENTTTTVNESPVSDTPTPHHEMIPEHEVPQPESQHPAVEPTHPEPPPSGRIKPNPLDWVSHASPAELVIIGLLLMLICFIIVKMKH